MGSLRHETTSCHAVALPYPGRGHINPMMNVCKLLVSKLPAIKITFVVTEEWLGFIGSDPKPSNIQFRTIPNVIPSELVRALDFVGFMDAVLTNMEAPFEELLEQLDSPVTTIIADTYVPFAVSVGNRRNVPVISLWTMSPAVFSVLYHFHLVIQNGHFPVDLSEYGGEMIDYIPGIAPTTLVDLPTVFNGKGVKVFDQVMEVLRCVRKAQSLLFTSFRELEAEVTDTLGKVLPFPSYSIGPSIPYGLLVQNKAKLPSSSSTYYFKWLDTHPKSSVLYISLGSFLSVSSEQMDEIMFGVSKSGVRFLWVARGDTSRIQQSCGEQGLVVSWCDQLGVLCHPSVGGFLTHCGWNSTLEGVFAGVPMLTFPLSFDQIPNGKLIADQLKVGLNMIESKVEAEGVVHREVIAMIVKKFMDLDDDENNEMRRRSSELKESCRAAVDKGGSSDANLTAFIKNILKCHV